MTIQTVTLSTLKAYHFTSCLPIAGRDSIVFAVTTVSKPLYVRLK